MAISYDTLGSTVTINPVGAVPAGQLNTDVAIVGTYDAANSGSSVNAGEVTQVNSGTEAADAFGADSELTYQAKMALIEGASVVHGVPLPTTNTTENFGSSSATSSGTVSNVPVVDPRVSPSYDVTAQDVTEGTSVDVSFVDASPPSQPSNSNTMNFNPETGEWAADATSEYDITYDYADYTNAIETAAGETVRNIAVCTEDDTVESTVKTTLEDGATNFRFGRAVYGSEPDLQPGEISSYTPGVEDWRVVEVAPSRGTSSDGKVRTVGAIAGLLARQPIDVTGSITYDEVTALDSLEVEYTPNEAEQFSQVTALTDTFEVAEGVTTSSESSFRDIYAVEIIDFVVEELYRRIKDYRGGPNTQNDIRLFRSRIRRGLSAMAAPNATPPLLATGEGGTPYYVSVSQGSTDTETDLDVGIEVAPIAKEVILDLSVGPIQFSGATTQ